MNSLLRLLLALFVVVSFVMPMPIRSSTAASASVESTGSSFISTVTSAFIRSLAFLGISLARFLLLIASFALLAILGWITVALTRAKEPEPCAEDEDELLHAQVIEMNACDCEKEEAKQSSETSEEPKKHVAIDVGLDLVQQRSVSTPKRHLSIKRSDPFEQLYKKPSEREEAVQNTPPAAAEAPQTGELFSVHVVDAAPIKPVATAKPATKPAPTKPTANSMQKPVSISYITTIPDKSQVKTTTIQYDATSPAAVINRPVEKEPNHQKLRESLASMARTSDAKLLSLLEQLEKVVVSPKTDPTSTLKLKEMLAFVNDPKNLKNASKVALMRQWMTTFLNSKYF